MKYIAHRVNTLDELLALDDMQGIEFDVRDSGGICIVTHDPFTTGPDLDLFLSHVGSRFCIINIKSEGIEFEVLKLLRKYNINEFFFLDCSIPMMNKLANQGEQRFAVRFSEFEPVEFVRAWSGKATWVWVDCFQTYLLTRSIAEAFRAAGFRICLVSPELQGRPDEIEMYATTLVTEGVHIDMVCSKRYNHSRWKNCLHNT